MSALPPKPDIPQADIDMVLREVPRCYAFQSCSSGQKPVFPRMHFSQPSHELLVLEFSIDLDCSGTPDSRSASNSAGELWSTQALASRL